MLQRGLVALVLLVACVAPVLCAGTVPTRFELRIPEEGSAAFAGDEIALTRERVSQLVIDVLNPTAKEIETDRIYPRINGEAASTISELRRTRRGMALVLDLEMKPHLKLDPGTNTVEIVAENHRGRRFYRNWILRLHERTHHEWFTYERVDGPGQSNPSPPEIVVQSPLVPPVVEKGAAEIRVHLQADVTAYHPLASVTAGGVAEPVAEGSETARIDRRLTIPRSRREVVVSAADVRGNETRVRIPVRTTAAPRPPKLSGKTYLLSIGVSDHQAAGHGFPFLPGAATAAADLDRLLRKEVAMTQDAVLVLRDRDATLARVKSALRDFVARPGPDDLLIVYFAAYGFHGQGPEVDQTFLSCWDTRLDQLRTTALSLEQLANLLGDPERIRSRNVLLLFEPRPLPELDSTLAGSNLVNAQLLRLFSAEQGRTVLVSADVNQDSRSQQTENGLRGVFASALVKGLEGEADWNRDRILTVAELVHFVTERVKAESGGAQIPKYRIADATRALVPVSRR